METFQTPLPPLEIKTYVSVGTTDLGKGCSRAEGSSCGWVTNCKVPSAASGTSTRDRNLYPRYVKSRLPLQP
eukprot:6146264-Amphidinium_carterae.3